MQQERRVPATDDARASALHPRTVAAWARAIALRGVYLLPDTIGAAFDAWAAAHPRAAAWRLAWPERCDRAAMGSWLALPVAERARRNAESEQYWREYDARREQEAAARRKAELSRIEAERARLRGEGRDTGDPERRASAFLAAFQDVGANGLWLAALHAVRGFALGEAAIGPLELEYLPRYHRKVPRGELVAVVRRALRSGRMEWGCKLTEDRRG